MQSKELFDNNLGRLLVKVNARARSIILRTRTDGIYITVPPGVSEREVLRAVEKFRERLLKEKSKVVKRKIDLDFKINTEYFKLNLIKGNHAKFLAHTELGNMNIICPPTADFADENLQTWLNKVVEEAIRKNAKAVLPSRLKKLSVKFDLPYELVRINSSKGRWGSCSIRKHINLSYYLILLPSHLIDYVLLHELCHTKEMNHSDRFWSLLDKFTEGRALELRAELRKYKTEIVA